MGKKTFLRLLFIFEHEMSFNLVRDPISVKSGTRCALINRILLMADRECTNSRNLNFIIIFLDLKKSNAQLKKNGVSTTVETYITEIF